LALSAVIYLLLLNFVCHDIHNGNAGLHAAGKDPKGVHLKDWKLAPKFLVIVAGWLRPNVALKILLQKSEQIWKQK
jgi:hypothetical protein